MPTWLEKNQVSTNKLFVSTLNSDALRLVFTSDGVVIRSVEQYHLVKTQTTESEAEHWFCICLRCLQSSENCIVGVASRSGRINQWQCSIPVFAIGWFFRFCFRLRQPSFHWIISDGVVNGIGNGNVLILPTPIPSSYDAAYDSNLRFSLGHKLSYDSDSDSVASENQPLGNSSRAKNKWNNLIWWAGLSHLFGNTFF